MRVHCTSTIKIILLIGFVATTLESWAQNLEPRLLSAAPVKTNFAVVGYGYSTGNILLESTLPIEDLRANLNNFVFGYGRTFGVLGKLGRVDVIVPTSLVTLKAVVEGVDTSANRNGMGDPQIRFSMILAGVPAQDAVEFAQTQQKPYRLGLQFAVKPPLGKYKNTQLINLGTNRWAFKLGVAGAYILNSKWVFEAHVNAWAFTANNDFNQGNKLKQEGLLSFQTHVTYIFNRRMWAAAGIGTNTFGETRLNDVEQSDAQTTLRSGAAFAYRFGKRHGLKASLTNNLVQRKGADFTSFTISYQYLWISK